MSKILMMVTKNGRLNYQEMMERIAERVNPDNIKPKPTFFRRFDNGFFAVFNPNEMVTIVENNIHTGGLVSMHDTWWKVQSEKPEGSYAIIRNNGEKIEAITDLCGSRPIWYYLDDEKFAISTSQRAIFPIIGDFKIDPLAVSWFLSAGQMGPGYSWDPRVKMMPPNSILLFDLRKCNISLNRDINTFAIDTNNKFEKRLPDEIDRTFRSMNLKLHKCVVNLSGGYDSRGLLLFSRRYGQPSAMTRALKATSDEKGTDAFVAQDLTKKLKLKHHIYLLDEREEDLPLTIDRFIKTGEGRIDHVNHYMDGIYHYKDLFERGYIGIFRGEESFGNSLTPRYYNNDKDVRRVMGALLFEDYRNIDLGSYGFIKPFWPDHLKQRPGETFPQWRDRTHVEYRIPYCLSSFNCLISTYLEVISPLSSSNILKLMFKVPDVQRNDRRLWKKIIQKMSPSLCYSKKDSIPNIMELVSSDPFRRFIRNELEKYHGGILTREFIEKIIDETSSPPPEIKFKFIQGIRSWLNELVPGFIKLLFHKHPGEQTMNYYRLAFRCYIIARIEEIFKEDSLLFSE